jgi:phage-related minor tail protein
VTTRKSSMGASSIYSDTHSEFDSAIDEIENKISLLKLENSKFFENIDFLNDDFVENEEINKVP